MAIRLEKGENRKLDLNVFHVGLGWDVNKNITGDKFDLDVSAFMITESGKILSDDYLVFYNSEKRVRPANLGKIVLYTEFSSDIEMRQESRPVDPELSVIGAIDDEDGETSEDGDDEIMDINLDKVNPKISEIVICVSIYKFAERRQNFGQVERAYVRLYKPGQAEGEGEYIYDLTEDFSACTAVEFCRIYRKNGEWKIKATGIGYKGGLQELVNKFA
jgi:tellurium resistance protein TerD